ncbi:MAG TPA: hypothetical protein VEK57_20345 [Thermoanaerobaculia bacterium]|nr:hypothetical protein [Thermoanaerobaculia bacterium]
MSGDSEQGRPRLPGAARPSWHRHARTLLGWFGIFIGVVGIASIVAERRAADRLKQSFSDQAARFRAQERGERTATAGGSAVMWRGWTLRPGDRVRITKWAGTFKPEDTGAGVEVAAGRGQIGVVVRGERRQSTVYTRIDPAEPIQIVRVRWLPQRWKASGSDTELALEEFEATIHVSYLEVIR